jgi:ribonucleotide reductase alpha subunit
MRPAGSVTKRSYGVSSGPISFLHVYNTAFGVIKQQGRHGMTDSVCCFTAP